MIRYQPNKKYVISKDKVTGFWEMECRYCSHVEKCVSFKKAIKAMNQAERNHRGIR